ncbi:nitrate ABC transporter substrate-binding protein [bacterium]|nr:MAG: nitrate ABC transporter substrate-binding protein [bacterium]
MSKLTRRELLRELLAAGLSMSAAAAVLSGCGSPSSNTAQSSTGASTSKGGPIQIGFIPLTDCASVVVAQEMGLFKKHGVDVQVVKQANWLAVRDKLSSGELSAAHCLFGMPFSVAAGVSKAQGDPLKIAMILNNNGQATTLSSKNFAGVKYADFAGLKSATDKLRASGKQPTFAMTFPGGTHDMWMHLTLAGAGIDPKSVQVKVIPPPQMVANMTAGNMDGYNVGEPWGAKAVADKVGFTFIATQDLWKDHPEKALVVNGKFADERRDDLKKMMTAILEASQFIDDMKNRDKVAEIIGTKAYTGAEPDVIRDRLAGKYDLGGGNGTKDFTSAKDYMLFHNGGLTNFPRKSYGIWFLTQYVRFGKLDALPADHEKLVESILLQDLYKEVAGEMKIAVPDDDMKPITVAVDKVAFDPAKPLDALKTYTARTNFLKNQLA